MTPLRLHPDDDAGVFPSGECAGHKVALHPIRKGAQVRKYGFPIGVATQDIAEGEIIHTHNLRTQLSGELRYTWHPENRPRLTGDFPSRTFKGYRRSDGRVGVRNDIFIIPTVACVNGLCRRLAAEFHTPQQPVLALEHPYGCSQLGEDHERTANALAALARHPNAAGALVVGLGCENNTLHSFRQRTQVSPCGHSILYLQTQECPDEYTEAKRLLTQLLREAECNRREEILESELVVGVKCGGSDGLSGITANTVIGRVSDRLCVRGASVAFTEIPELFGAEQSVLDRCVDESVFEKAASILNGFKRHYLSRNLPVFENPSPGNKAGGITTLEEKSLGCVHKSGRGPVAEALDYAQAIAKKGVSMIWGPGNDPCACTALAAAGCHIILFSTGRGTPYGTIVPTVKISSNTPLAQRKPGWIDFDAGGTILGRETFDECAERLYSTLLATASGEPAANERNGFQEICLFKDGVTL